eukprot:TRINITY_DN13828_c0_g1_i1.p1 TRINITY_DN13828_c0_g1~~TRINITY_DN13828_c0_g1_i1.p1  ORF type:complete len:304 (+),score=72.63 TRINITY_DN13828_c0_g1_i1:31-912(+)
MGQKTTKPQADGFSLPPSIAASSLNSSSPHCQSAAKQLYNSFKRHGFASVCLDEEISRCLKVLDSFYQAGDEFFEKDLSQKQTLKQVNSKSYDSRGYVQVEHLKEYLKVTNGYLNEIPQCPKELTDAYDAAYPLLRDISWLCFKEFMKFKENENMKSLLSPSEIDTILGVADSMSSLSLIHYFKKNDKEFIPTFPKSDKVPDSHSMPSLPHQDTGLLTLAVVSKVPGLQIFDKRSQDWLEVEKLYPPKTLLLWLGEKVPLFSGSNDFEATLHRVVLDKLEERTSMIFLLDVGK